jgi:hypothetical protein
VEDSFKYPYEVRMIEANTNPSIEESCELLKQLVPRMLDDLFKLVLDPIFIAPEQQQLLWSQFMAANSQRGFPVDGY